MDIFKYADSIHWMADYYDWHTGYIYAISEAKDTDRNHIKVYENGVLIGYVHREC